ncbi:MFS transporter [Penicillium brasilianum]|uniref:MFS transporter n=1 Tax=Penicillium brasilianum TaxID=104259 RepID=A0A1S9RU61_PENBI|nr:MFS transporter [Penicillium brasilianum]
MEEEPKLQSIPMQDFTATDDRSKHSAEETVGEDVDYVREDIQSKVSKQLWILIVFTILSSTFLFALDNTIVADVQSPIVETFGEVDKLSWLGVAFVLSGSATILTWGKLYGIFSVKWLYLSSLLLFEIGSAICGAALNMNMLIVGRAVAGLGGSGMYLGCLNLLSLTTSIRQRPQYIALTGITWGSGTVLGPVVGGAFTQNHAATWRWAFYINLCIGAAFLPVYIGYLPRCDPQPGVSKKQKLMQIDYLGIILIAGMLTALNMGIIFGSTTYDWKEGLAYVPWIITALSCGLFITQQLFCIGTTPSERIVQCQFIGQRLMLLFFTLMAAASTCVFVPTYYIPLYFQFVRGDSALTAAVRLLPFIILMVAFGFLNGALMSKLGYYMPWYLGGGILTTIGGALMSTVNETSSNARIYGYTSFIGIGAGMFIQAGFSVAQAKVSTSRETDATSFMSWGQNMGIMISLAISGAVFQNNCIDKLKHVLPNLSRNELKAVISGNDSEIFRRLDDDTRTRVLQAIVWAMSRTYFLVVTAGAMAILGSLTMKRERIFIKASAAA